MAILMLSGCFANLSEETSPVKSPPDSTLGPKNISLSNFTISNVSSLGFGVAFDYEGDSNENSEIKLFLCSVKALAGCDPLSGVSVDLTKGVSKFSADINLSSLGLIVGDLVKYKIDGSDIDGISGIDVEGFLIIPHDSSQVKTISQLGYISLGKKNNSFGSDFLYASALDSAGNIYLTGATTGNLGELNSGEYDIFVAKLLPSGSLDTSFNETGIKQLGLVAIGAAANGEDYPTALSLDSSGNIYIAGATSGSLGETNSGNYDAFVVKMLPTGALDLSFNSTGIKQLGSVSVGVGANGYETVNAIVLDSSGNIFIAGGTSGSLGETNSGSNDGYVAKLLPSGALDTSFNGSGIKQLGNVSVGVTAAGSESFQDIKIDNSGLIYLAGETSGSLGETKSGGNDAFVVRLLSTGSLDTSFSGIGIKQLGNLSVGAAANGNEGISALTLDGDGNIYLAGATGGSLGEASAGSNDAFVVKILSSGSLDTSFNTSGIKQLGNISVGAGASAYENVLSMEIDAASNIYVAGYTSGALGEANSGSNDAFVFKLLPSGSLDPSFNGSGVKQLGNVTVGTNAGGNETLNVINLDSSGNIYLSGYTNGSLGEYNAGDFDVFTVKLLPSGSLDTSFNSTGIKQLGVVTLGTGAAGSESVQAIALDSSGNIYLAGTTTGAFGEANAGASDAFVAKLLPTGQLDASFNGKGIKQLGKVSVGTGASGTETIAAIALDSSENIYIAGYTSGAMGEVSGGNNDAFVAKILPSGNLDSSFNTTGIKQLGNISIGANASGNDNVYAMSLDSSGNIYIAGSTSGPLDEALGGGSDAFVAKLLSSGDIDTSFSITGLRQLGISTVGVASAGVETVTGMVLDTSGNIYVVGDTSGGLGEANAGETDTFVFKLLPTGSLDTSFNSSGILQLGSVSVGAGASSPQYSKAIGLDSSGNIYVAGSTIGSMGEITGGSRDAFVTKILSTGSLDTSFSGNGIRQLGNVTVGSAAAGLELVNAMSVDTSGGIYLAGTTSGSLGEANAGSADGYLVKLLPSGGLDTSFNSNGIKQFGNISVGSGASGSDSINAISLDSSGNIFLGGSTPGSMGEFSSGLSDAILIAIEP